MRIIAVDDEKIALEGLMRVLEKAAPEEEIHGFRKGSVALDYVRKCGCDIAFLDIEMRDLKGIDLAAQLKTLNPNINIIFTTGYIDYAAEAFSLHASGYVMKPVTLEKIQNELSELRYRVNSSEKEKISIRAFGSFEVFDSSGRPLKFQYKKTRELLAYLVDRRGDLCSMREIMEVLWEQDDPDSHVSYAKNLRADLRNTLKKAGALEVLVRRRGYLAIHPNALQCDYYDYLKDPELANCTGEYMNQYGWAQTTRDELEKTLHKQDSEQEKPPEKENKD